MIVCANFKANKTRQETQAYMAVVESFVSANDISDTVIVFPPFTALEHNPRNVLIGVQNAYPVRNGAYTGEIGLEQLEEFGIKTSPHPGRIAGDNRAKIPLFRGSGVCDRLLYRGTAGDPGGRERGADGIFGRTV